jgi:cell division protein ZipA
VDIKTWILIGGGLLLLAVIGHGFWLAWRNRRETLRLEIDPNVPQDDIDPLELLRGELPNGGARVRTVDPALQQDAFAFPATESLPSTTQARPVRTAPDDRIKNRAPTARPAATRRTASPRPLTAHAGDRITGTRAAPTARRAAESAPTSELEPEPAHEAPLVAIEDSPPARSSADASPDSHERHSMDDTKPPVPEEVIIINVLARNGGEFHGTGLMEAFMRNGLKYGDMNIFHRIDAATRTPQFSLASAVEPGTFDLNAMDDFRTRGVCLFMPLPLTGRAQPLAVFEDMLTVARDLARSLGGDLKDEAHSVMTAQNIEHCRQRIADFTRKQLSRP